MATESMQMEALEAPPIGLRAGSRFLRPVEFIAALFLVAIVGLLLMGVTSRYVLSLPVVWIDEAAPASAMAWALTQTGFAFKMAALVTDLPGGWATYMLVTIAVFMVLGCVLEGLPAIVLLAPIMYPIAKNLGINDIHYSMVVVTAMNIGLMAPPIGVGFYIACKIGNVSPDEAMGAIWPYIGALFIGLLIIAFVPALSIAYL